MSQFYNSHNFFPAKFAVCKTFRNGLKYFVLGCLSEFLAHSLVFVFQII